MSSEHLERLGRSLSIIEHFRSELHFGSPNDALDRSTVTGTIQIGSLSFDHLREFTLLGNRVEINIQWDGFRATLEADGSPAFDIQQMGRWEDAYDDPATVDAARDAADRNRADIFLGVSKHLKAEFTATLVNNPVLSGFGWIRTRSALDGVLTSNGWLGSAQVLVPSPSAFNRLVIGDAEGMQLRAANLLVHGPDIFPEPHYNSNGLGEDYRARYLDEHHRNLPTPWSLNPVAVEGLDALAAKLRGIAFALCWLWLADSIQMPDRHTVRATYIGQRLVLVDVKPNETVQLDPMLDLWTWTVDGAQPGRVAASRKAITFSVNDAADLGDAAVPILQSATYVFELAQQDLVQEAFTARRAAREAAIDAARAAADRARSAARSVVDRALLQVAASVGVLVANKGNVIDKGVATWLLLAVLVLIIGTTAVAFGFEYPGAEHGLTTFRKDLATYRDTLTSEDIARINKLSSLGDADREIGRAKITTAGALVGAALVVILVLLGVRVTDTTTPAKATTGSSTTSNSRPATTAPPSGPAP
jgi:hypothetical protein